MISFSLVWLPTRFLASTRIARKICFDSFSKNFTGASSKMFTIFFYFENRFGKSIFQDTSLPILLPLRGEIFLEFPSTDVGLLRESEHVWRISSSESRKLEGKEIFFERTMSMTIWGEQNVVCSSSNLTFCIICWNFFTFSRYSAKHISIIIDEWICESW